jgi:MFS family permease
VLVSCPIFSGLAVYLILSFLLIPERISIPVGILFSVLIFGLINYYQVPKNLSAQKTGPASSVTLDKYLGKNSGKGGYEDRDISRPGLFFILLYIVCLVIVAFGSHANREIFLPWDQISPLQIIQLTAAILISFFVPGYAIISILAPKDRLELLPRTLLAYVLSIFITGITTYVTASLGADFSTTSNIVLLIYALVFVSFIALVFLARRDKSRKKGVKHLDGLLLPLSFSITKRLYKKWINSISKSSSELIVFVSFFALVVLSTYFLYGGVIIGDQWFHHGRALSFASSTFNVASLSDEYRKDPPFFPAFLAGFFDMSGIPSVNAYAAIDFLNIVPVFAFYYFFSKWVPVNRRRAALLASVLFMLSSGFGWVYLLYLADANHATSEQASLDAFNDARIKSFDIFQPSSFVAVDHPGISSPLIVVSLPAGFVLLGLIAQKAGQKESKIKRLNYLVIVTIVSLVGALSHPEFYLFVFTASILALIFKLPRRNTIFVGFIISMALIALIDLLPGQYFSAIKIVGIPLTYLSLAFTLMILVLSIFATRVSSILIFRKTKRPLYRGRLAFPLSIALASILAYFYAFTFLVWGDLSLQDVRLQTASTGQQEVPWYLYPMKLGTCGLLGLALLVSYLFKRFEKEIFVFVIISIVALFTGTYYDEHRFSKYIMVGLVGLAAILVYDIIATVFLIRKGTAKPSTRLPMILVSIVISLTIISASMSAILYTGYSALAMDNHYRPFDRDLPKRYFPSPSEISLLKFVYSDLSKGGKNYNVVVSPEGYDIRQQGFTGKLEAFAGIPTNRLLQGRPVLEASTLERFYQLLNSTNTKYIVLPKEDIISGRNYTNAISSTSRSTDKDLIEPARFALANFKKVYEDNDYVVLSVPDNLISAKEGSNSPKPDEDENPDTKTAWELGGFLRFPGDISERAKRGGAEVPWEKVMYSEISIVVAILIPTIAFILGKRSLSRRTKLKNKKL